MRVPHVETPSLRSEETTSPVCPEPFERREAEPWALGVRRLLWGAGCKTAGACAKA